MTPAGPGRPGGPGSDNGHMDAVNFSNTCRFQPCTGSGPWAEADLENGLFAGADSRGSFFEGVMTKGYPSTAADAAVQANIAAAGYEGNSGGVHTAPSAAGPAVVHDGYTSAYTVGESSNHLQETYLPAMGDPWSTQDLTAKYGVTTVA